MTEQTTAEILRKPFKPEEIGKLPRVTCPKCSDRACQEHQKSKCPVCQAYVSERHIHIDYVGHADVTSRLLQADPSWNWEPVAADEHGLPVFDTDAKGNPVGLWIKLTVGGVTRLGYGSVPSSQPDAVKVLIGDALRNAAMRFGVALDLWAKGDRADPTAENATASGGQAARGQRQPDAAHNGHVSEPADESAIAAWGAKVDEILSAEDADAADAELREVFKAGRMSAATANAVRAAIKAKASSVASGNGHAPAETDEAAQTLGARAAEAKTIEELRAVHEDARKARKLSAGFTRDDSATTVSSFIAARRAEIEAQMAAAPA